MDRNFFDFSGAGASGSSSSTLHPILTGTPSINLPSLPGGADFGTLVDDTSSHSPFGFDHTTTTTTNASNAQNPNANTDTSSGESAGNASTTTTTQLQQDLVMYYFENVRKVQYIFAGNSVTNVTYSLILQEPRGAVTNAVCALASLHHTGMRVAQGLESPDPNPEYSTARYFHDEAYLQLVNAKAIKGKYDAGDAIAALHLVSFSLFSGGATAWRQVLSVAYEWVAQSSGLLGSGDIDVQSKLVAMRSIEQVIVKTTMWFDVFSSISLMQPPKFFGLWKRLLAPTFWPGAGLSGDDLTNLAASPVHMEALMGCPDDAVLAIAEISALAHWKANEVRHGKLSLRELLRRGDGIEQALRANHGADIFSSPGSPLHPNLAQQNATGNGATADGDHQGTGSHSTDDMRRVVANIFREAALLYLQTVVNGCNPGVPEVVHSVEMIVQHFQQLPRSILDRSLVFPICIAGCMTDSSPQRDFLKGRLQAQDESWGNVMSTRALMESVWRKRDVSTGVGHSNNNRAIAVDWRESLLENSVLLLV
ncbi:hypothetical protein ONZ45_g3941 [Pleurotus djamor]|nr:hypothetical protein ONZ45_g3941 [Pleurotus djamor]